MRFLLLASVMSVSCANFSMDNSQAENNPVATKTCHVCNVVSKHKCAKCKSVSYCSRECQAADWPKHKVHCFVPVHAAAVDKMKIRASTEVIYIPQSHGFDGKMSVESIRSQRKIYDLLKQMVALDPDIKIVYESAFYFSDDDSKNWYGKNHSIDHDRAVDALYAEGVITENNLVKSVNIGPGSPYQIADEQYASLRTRLYARAFAVGQDRAINEIMPAMRKNIGIDREVEVIHALAKSIKEHPTKKHVLIFGRTHEFSRFFKRAPSIKFSIAKDFSEQPIYDQMQCTNEDYQKFFSTFKNPLEEI